MGEMGACRKGEQLSEAGGVWEKGAPGPCCLSWVRHSLLKRSVGTTIREHG